MCKDSEVWISISSGIVHPTACWKVETVILPLESGAKPREGKVQPQSHRYMKVLGQRAEWEEGRPGSWPSPPPTLPLSPCSLLSHPHPLPDLIIDAMLPMVALITSLCSHMPSISFKLGAFCSALCSALSCIWAPYSFLNFNLYRGEKALPCGLYKKLLPLPNCNPCGNQGANAQPCFCCCLTEQDRNLHWAMRHLVPGDSSCTQTQAHMHLC